MHYVGENSQIDNQIKEFEDAIKVATSPKEALDKIKDMESEIFNQYLELEEEGEDRDKKFKVCIELECLAQGFQLRSTVKRLTSLNNDPTVDEITRADDQEAVKSKDDRPKSKGDDSELDYHRKIMENLVNAVLDDIIGTPNPRKSCFESLTVLRHYLQQECSILTEVHQQHPDIVPEERLYESALELHHTIAIMSGFQIHDRLIEKGPAPAVEENRTRSIISPTIITFDESEE